MLGILKMGKTFTNRLDCFRAFGFDRSSLRQASWVISGATNRKVWVAKVGDYYEGQNLLGENMLSEDGLQFTDRRNPRRTDSKKYGENLRETGDLESILFLRTRRYENDRRDVFVFRGVFMPDLDKCVENVAVYKRVADACSLPEGSWQAE